MAIDDLAGRINPNLSAPSMLTALLGAVGTDPSQAQLLARAMVDWRTATPMSLAGGLKLDRYHQAGLPYGPPGRPFSGVDEIAQPLMRGGLIECPRGGRRTVHANVG